MKFFAAFLIPALFAFAPAQVHASSAPTETSRSRATLIQYTKETDLRALAANGKTVVFFFATWCPNCILTLTELSEKWSELDPDITLVIADYDQEVDLKAEFGVTYQDTFVLLTPEATVKRRWNAGGVAGVNENTAKQ